MAHIKHIMILQNQFIGPLIILDTATGPSNLLSSCIHDTVQVVHPTIYCTAHMDGTAVLLGHFNTTHRDFGVPFAVLLSVCVSINLATSTSDRIVSITGMILNKARS